MKIREGFVTNSSSTNFIIISKEKLTKEYLYKKMGFKKNSKIRSIGMSLCAEIISGAERGPRWFDSTEFNSENIKEIFGEKTAEKYKRLIKMNYNVYVGHTDSDSDYLTSHFTMDSFIIDQKDFFLDATNCGW